MYKSARLIKTKNATYKYDEEGFLIEKTENFQTWKYTWKANGLLESVSAPKNMSLYFSYDALGRRITKDRVLAAIQYVWDGNVLLHEWKQVENRPVAEDKRITWVFQGFVAVAKLQGGKAYSIISDHLGTPIVAVDNDGMEVWNRQLDIYGRVRKEYKHSSLGDDVFPFVPFLYQGQYYDFETNLAYNRFRYYSPETGAYISQDPIRLSGNNPNLYAYVEDPNAGLDIFGWHNPYPRNNGKFGPNPNPKPPVVKDKVHGNSHQSTETNYLYAKFDNEDEFLKWGKTDNLLERYGTKGRDDIDPVREGGNIVDIKAIERELAEKMPGKDNKERWAGAKKGEPLSPEAQKAYDKMLEIQKERKNNCKK